MISINFKVISLTQPGIEPATFGSPDLPARQMDALSIRLVKREREREREREGGRARDYIYLVYHCKLLDKIFSSTLVTSTRFKCGRSWVQSLTWITPPPHLIFVGAYYYCNITYQIDTCCLVAWRLVLLRDGNDRLAEVKTSLVFHIIRIGWISVAILYLSWISGEGTRRCAIPV